MVDMPVRSGEGCGPGAAEPGPAPKSRRRRANGTASSALVGAGGFEPPKSSTTDLQSAPFGHSGTLPCRYHQKVSHNCIACGEKLELVDGLEPPTC